MIRFHGKLVAAIVGTVLATVGVTGVAAATPAAPHTALVSLSASQQAEMQSKVTAWLHKSVGGRQISVNQIAFDGGTVVVTLPLPGEQQARAVNEAVVPFGTANCAFQHVCLWTGTHFNGVKVDRVQCGQITIASTGISSMSSMHNNQTTGTASALKNSSGQILNENLAPSSIDDLGVSGVEQATLWKVC
jgi:hypothetical protein